jgi:hypothetical protein
MIGMKKFGLVKKRERMSKLNKIDPELLKDPLFNLKYIAFCMAVKPTFEDRLTIAEFADFARFQLAASYKIPAKSTIWDKYTAEELIVEFYALKFFEDSEYSKEFEARLNGEAQEDLDWMNKEIEKNKVEIEKLKQQYPEKVNFSPGKGN